MKSKKWSTFMTFSKVCFLPFFASLVFLGNFSHAGILNKCDELLAGDIYKNAFQAKYKGQEPTTFEIQPAQANSESNIRLLATLKAQGADGYFAQVKFKITGKYESYEAALKDVAECNTTKTSGKQFQVDSFQEGIATFVTYQHGIVITELPKHYSSDIKARHRELMENGISVVVGYGLDIPIGAGAVAKTSNTFEAGRASGIIFGHPEMFGQLTLNHEMQHIYDMVLKTDVFFEELSTLPPKIATIVDKSIKGEPLTWIEKRREHSAMEYPRVWAETKASEQSIRSFFRLKGFREMILPKGRFREMFMAWTEVINYSFRNLQLFYYQMWIDPTNPRSIVFVFKSGASGYVFIKAIGLATQGAIYSIVYASSLTGLF